jgi:hypothetical protein
MELARPGAFDCCPGEVTDPEQRFLDISASISNGNRFHSRVV